MSRHRLISSSADEGDSSNKTSVGSRQNSSYDDVHHLRQQLTRQNVGALAAASAAVLATSPVHSRMFLLKPSTSSTAPIRQHQNIPAAMPSNQPQQGINYLDIPSPQFPNSLMSSPEMGRRESSVDTTAEAVSPSTSRRSPFKSFMNFKRRSISDISLVLDLIRGSGASPSKEQRELRHRTVSPMGYPSTSDETDGTAIKKKHSSWHSSLASLGRRSKSQSRRSGHLTLPKRLHWEQLSPQHIQRQMQLGLWLVLGLCSLLGFLPLYIMHFLGKYFNICCIF